MKTQSTTFTGSLTVGVLVLMFLTACGPKGTAADTAVADKPASTTAATPTAVASTDVVRYEAQSTGSKMRIDGTANIKNWHMDSVMIGGYVEADAKFPESALTDAKAAKPVVNVYMPVRSFKSGNGSMDGRMQKEMNEAKFKRIEYKLIELKPTSTAGSTGALKFDATGTLTIVGQARTNTMPVTIEKLADGKLKIAGVAKMKMTDFGIEPPTTLGLFTSGDDVTLTFEWLTAPKAEAPKAP